MPIPTDTIDKLEQTWRAISELGAQLDEQQWKLPSDNPGWTVQDNLSHLVGTERALQGLGAADVEVEPRPYVKNPIGAANERGDQGYTLEISETRALYDNAETRERVSAFLERRNPRPTQEPAA